jgi:NAD-dependent dihydropyrimidine dehydrogenase PreA subunit
MTIVKSDEKKIVRKIIKIDEDLCTGCGQCVIACAEGALAIIDGKAKVINEVFCDGLGACIGECPEGALEIIEREAAEFDEEAVEKHLEDLKEQEHLKLTLEHTYLGQQQHSHQCSCPSANTIVYENTWEDSDIKGEIPSALRQWPTKLTLVSPTAPYFNNKEIIVVSDCAPMAYGDFHRKILKGKPIVTVCPMLGLGEMELEKLEQILKQNPIESVNFVLMEVPCCQKIKIFLDPILSKIDRRITVEETIIGRDGKILRQAKI